MSEFIEPESLEEVAETLEAPKVKAKAPRKPKAPKVAPLNTESTFLEEQLLEECTPVAKKGKGRPKKVVEPVVEEEEEASPPKVKRVQTEAQKQNFVKALEKRRANIALRKALKEAQQEAKVAEVEAKKKEIERKVVKKAIVLKKREVLEQTALDEIEDLDVPDEIVEKIIKKQRAKAQPKPKQVVIQEPVAPPTQKYNFV